MTKASQSVSIESLEAAVTDHVQRAGMSQAAAEAIAELSVAALCSVLGGSQIYFPKRLVQAYRDRRIYELANGHNSTALAEEFGLSRSRVEQVVHRERRSRRKG